MLHQLENIIVLLLNLTVIMGETFSVQHFHIMGKLVYNYGTWSWIC